MQPPQQHSWINLVEIKGQLIKKLGMERSKQYLDYLNRFLSLKLTKSDFDKLCLKTLGKDNIRLHNQLIRSVLNNACTKAPSKTVGNKKQSDEIHHQITSPLTLTNGDILPPSPRKARTGTRDRRVTNPKSALGPNGKTNNSSFSPSIPQSGDSSLVLENGNKKEHIFLDQSQDKFAIKAPLGVPFCPVSVGGAPQVSPSQTSSKCVSLQHGLLETVKLKDRMEQIATPNGAQQVSIDCANVLNSGLDSYLKGIIRSCIELKGARPVHEPEPKPKRVVTLLDFRVAMELNCKQLGEDWPILLEKISTRDFEE